MQVLRNRRFALLVAGQAVNGIGSWCALIAMWGYAAYRFDAGPAKVALIGLGFSLPGALLGPLAGIPIDRLGPKRVLMLGDAAAAAISLGLVFAGSYTMLVVLATLHGIAGSFAEPAFNALPPRLVADDELLAGNALLGAASHLAIAVGPLVAAVSIATVGLRSVFVIDALTYLVGVAVVAPVRLGTAPPVATTSIRHELREGFAVVRRQPTLRIALGLSSAVYFAWGAYAVVEPLYVRDVLHRPPETFALLQMAFGVCLLVTGLVVARTGRRLAHLVPLAVVGLATGFAAGLYVGTTVLAIAFAGVSTWGVCTACFVAPALTVVQRATPVEAHGRVLALDATLKAWAHVVALTVIGLVAAGVGVRAAGLAAASVPTMGGLVVLALVRRRATAGAEVPTVEPALAGW